MSKRIALKKLYIIHDPTAETTDPPIKRIIGYRNNSCQLASTFSQMAALLPELLLKNIHFRLMRKQPAGQWIEIIKRPENSGRSDKKVVNSFYLM
jgi:hypothetical protein